MSLQLNIDMFQHDNFAPLKSHTSVWDLDKTFTVSGLVELPKPIYSILNNYLNRAQRMGYTNP